MLSGLELRKAVLFKVLGWTYWAYPGDKYKWMLLPPNDAGTRMYITTEKMTLQPFDAIPTGKLAGNSPAIETDSNLSERMFQEFCDKHNLQWEMWHNNHSPERCISLTMTYRGAKLNLWGIDRVYGSTPSEARARAILAGWESGR